MFLSTVTKRILKDRMMLTLQNTHATHTTQQFNFALDRTPTQVSISPTAGAGAALSCTSIFILYDKLLKEGEQVGNR